MKKLLLIIMMLNAHAILFAQTTIDTVDIRICYDTRTRAHKNARKRTDEHRLDIGKNGVSKYYSHWKTVEDELLDSVLAAGGDFADFTEVRHKKGNPHSSFEYTIFKNYQKPDQLTGICTPYADGKFLFTEEMGQEWELVGDSVYYVLDHPCRKATARYHGHTWTAYYATDIPISEGPWKLCGLPGLIMYARNADKDYIFKCMAIKTHVNEPITIDKKNALSVTPQKLEKIIFEYRSDPFGQLKARMGDDIKVKDSKGREIKQQTYEPVLMDYYEKDK